MSSSVPRSLYSSVEQFPGAVAPENYLIPDQAAKDVARWVKSRAGASTSNR